MVTLKRGRILRSWGTLLIGCQGEEEGFFRMVEQTLDGLKPPEVSWKRETVSTGLWQGMVSGRRRDYILLKHDDLKDYLLCVGARDYGTSLDVCWYLTLPAKSVFVATLLRIPFVGVFVALVARFLGLMKDLDIFEEQDLTAFVSAARYAVRKTVEDVLRRKDIELAIDWDAKAHLEAA